MNLSEAQTLLTPEGDALLVRARASRGKALHRRHRALSKEAGAHAARVALHQDELRVRAARKTPHADAWLFEREALEQATTWAVACDRATRWPREPVRPLIDVGAGLGFDALAAARAGVNVIAFEASPLRAALLRHNASTLELAGRLDVRNERFELARHGTLLDDALLFVDPDRRDASGRRAKDPASFNPPFATWRAWAERAYATMVKLPPSLGMEGELGARPYELVSLQRDAKERRVFWGNWPQLSACQARILPQGLVFAAEQPDVLPTLAVESGMWLFDPDAALRHARLVRAFGATHGLQGTDATAHYLLSTTHPPEALLAWGAWLVIDEVVPARKAPVQAWLQEHGVGRLEIRKRGLNDRASAWRKALRLAGPRAGCMTLLPDATGRPRACLSLCDADETQPSTHSRASDESPRA